MAMVKLGSTPEYYISIIFTKSNRTFGNVEWTTIYVCHDIAEAPKPFTKNALGTLLKIRLSSPQAYREKAEEGTIIYLKTNSNNKLKQPKKRVLLERTE